MAQLKGKLTREEEGLEDLLTSNVFGSFKYALPGEGLVPFLARAVQDDGKTKPLENLSSIETCSYEFWPSYLAADSKRCETDLLITIGDENETRLLIMIEAKYRSPKSGFPSDVGELTDQLAREWDVLEKIPRGRIKMAVDTAPVPSPLNEQNILLNSSVPLINTAKRPTDRNILNLANCLCEDSKT